MVDESIGEVYELPVPKLFPPVAASYHDMVPTEVAAEIVAVLPAHIEAPVPDGAASVGQTILIK